MNGLCEGCQRPAELFLCPGCLAKLDDALAAVPFLAAELDVVLMRDVSRGGGAGYVRGTTERPLPVDLDAAETAWALHNTLVGIVRDLTETRGVRYTAPAWAHPDFIGPLPAGLSRGWLTRVDTSPTLSIWLRCHLASIALDPSAAEVLGDVLSVVELAWRAIENPSARVWLGRCDVVLAAPTEGDPDAVRYCGADVRAFVDADLVRCRGCGTTHLVTEFARRARELLADYHLTARELAGLLPGFKPGRVKVWRRRGKIEPVGRDLVTGADLWRVGDVLDVLRYQQIAEVHA